MSERVLTLIADTLDVMPLEVLPGVCLRDDLGATDHDLDRLRRTIGKAYGVHVPADIGQGWRQVADVVAYVAERGLL